MQTLDFTARTENHTFFSVSASCKMDYPQKMGMAPQQKLKNDDDDDEDLEALRLAALQSLRTKDTLHSKRQPPLQVQKVVPQVTQITRPSYKSQRLPRRGYFHSRLQQRQNGNFYYQSPRNPNLIAIVPVEEHSELQQVELSLVEKEEKTESSTDTNAPDDSKFQRYKDSGSGSEEEENRKNTTASPLKVEPVIEENTVANEEPRDVENDMEATEDSQKNEEEENVNDDDDDILLMADLEEEDSLERLMDEMEREMNVDKPSDKKEKDFHRKEKQSIEAKKNQEQKRLDDSLGKKENDSSSITNLSTVNSKNDRKSVSPHLTNRITQKRRSLSPKLRSRKKSPRRSPRRSPSRQIKKLQRETTRYRSPRKSPSRYSPRARSPRTSPRARSPRLSPRRSPGNRSPVIRRSPHRKTSPRGRSPRLSPHCRSPRLSPHCRSPKSLRSRSPRISSRSKSPRPQQRSPKVTSRSRSPQQKSRSKSPRQSPRRSSPLRRSSPRSRSPGLSPRRGSPRMRSPKLSPRRGSPRLRSPRPSPKRSPWSSPRNSPRLSPSRRRRSPKWSPKEPNKKHSHYSNSPDNNSNSFYNRETSPLHKRRISPEPSREKIKQKEEHSEKLLSTESAKEPSEILSDPVLEARRRKFESTKPIDPIHANKKIKLSNSSKKAEVMETSEVSVSMKKSSKVPEQEFDMRDTNLCVEANYEFEELESTMENASPIAISCMELSKGEKERSSKKKKKRDKEIYQAGKLKNELPLSERIGKDKKCKKRKDVIPDVPKEDVDAIFEDITVEEEGDLRAELSRKRAERLKGTVPIQSARLVQSAFKGVVNEVVKNNAKAKQRHVIKSDDKLNQKDVRRVTVVHRSVSELHDSEEESSLDSKVPIRFRLGHNKQVQDARESKVSRKASKRQSRKVKHKSNLSLTDPEHVL